MIGTIIIIFLLAILSIFTGIIVWIAYNTGKLQDFPAFVKSHIPTLEDIKSKIPTSFEDIPYIRSRRSADYPEQIYNANCPTCPTPPVCPTCPTCPTPPACICPTCPTCPTAPTCPNCHTTPLWHTSSQTTPTCNVSSCNEAILAALGTSAANGSPININTATMPECSCLI